MHDSVYEIAHGDPRLAKALRAGLTKRAAGPDSALKEMAEGVLSGHVDLCHAAMSQACNDDFDHAFSRFRTHYDQLDPDERNHLIDTTEHQLDELLDELAAPQR